MKKLAFAAATAAFSLTACGGYESNEAAYEDNAAYESGEAANYGAGTGGEYGGTATAEWPEGARIVEEGGVTYRIDPGGTRIALGPNDSRIVIEDGTRFRVDPSGTRVRIDDRGAVISVGPGGADTTVSAGNNTVTVNTD